MEAPASEGSAMSGRQGEPAVAVPDGPYVAIVANPYHRSAAHVEKVGALAQAIRERGRDVVVLWEKDGLARLAPQGPLPGDCRCVVAAGGDGTLARAIAHDLGETPVAPFPLGNENLFARHFGFTSDPERLAAAVVRGETRPIDVGRVNGRRFTIVTSAGFDGAVAHRLHEMRARGDVAQQAHRLSYLRPLASAAVRYRPPMMEVTIDGERTMTGALVMVFNLPRYGLGLDGLYRGADPTDGRLDYLVFERPSRAALLRYAASTVFGGRHLRLPDVHVGTARRLQIKAAEPVPMQTDGEATGHTPAVIEVDPGWLQVIVP